MGSLEDAKANDAQFAWPSDQVFRTKEKLLTQHGMLWPGQIYDRTVGMPVKFGEMIEDPIFCIHGQTKVNERPEAGRPWARSLEWKEANSKADRLAAD